MTTQRDTWWMRTKEGLGVWEHRGKVAVVGRGHSPMDRRWDGKSMDKTLGAYSIIAAQKAMDDAGVSPDQVDGVISAPGPLGARWAPQPYFEPPYDSEDGLTMVTAEWLIKGLGLKNVKYTNNSTNHIGLAMGLASQSVGDGLCSVCLVLYPVGNLEGRYRHSDNTYARGNLQWINPWGHGTPPFEHVATVFEQYCRKYGTNHDRLAPFVVNQRRNGLMVPWGFYAQHDLTPLTVEDYLSARWICKPVGLFDCDRPVQHSTCYLFTTAERAKDMAQPPAYILSHSQNRFRAQSSIETLEEQEAWTDSMARKIYEGSGLTPSELDVINPYDGYTNFTQLYLEALQWQGVKRGDVHDFYNDDIRVEGPHPLCPSGGNNGTGRTRTAIYTDCIEQIQGRAGARQVKIRCETAAAGNNLPTDIAWTVFSKHPS